MSDVVVLLVCKQQGQTPLSIAQRLGYISVVEVLKNITDVEATPVHQDDKYNMLSPETMQETLMTDSEDEAGQLRFAPSVIDRHFLPRQFFAHVRVNVVILQMTNNTPWVTRRSTTLPHKTFMTTPSVRPRYTTA